LESKWKIKYDLLPESVSDYNGGVWHCVNAVKGVASGGSSSSDVGDIDSGSGVVTDSNGVEADGNDETRDAAGKPVVEGIVVGGSNDADDDNACDNADHGEACDDADDVEVYDDANNGDEFDDTDGGFDGNGYVGAVRDSVDGRGSADDASESTRNHTVEGANLIMQLKALEIKELRMQIWRMTSYVKQLKKANYGIVVGLKVAQSELRWLRKAECDVQRNKSITVVKNNMRMVKDLVTEKIGIEVSRQAEGQRLAVEQVDTGKCLAAGECRPIGQWEHSDRRDAKEAEGWTARRAARNKYIKREKKEDLTKPPKLLLLSAVQFCSHQRCVFQPCSHQRQIQVVRRAQGRHKLWLLCLLLRMTCYCSRLLQIQTWKCLCLLQCSWMLFLPPLRAQVC